MYIFKENEDRIYLNQKSCTHVMIFFRFIFNFIAKSDREENLLSPDSLPK